MKVPRQQQQAGNSTGTTIANKDEGQVNDQRKDDSKKGSNSTNQSANQNKKDEGQAKKAAVDAKKEDGRFRSVMCLRFLLTFFGTVSL